MPTHPMRGLPVSDVHGAIWIVLSVEASLWCAGHTLVTLRRGAEIVTVRVEQPLDLVTETAIRAALCAPPPDRR